MEYLPYTLKWLELLLRWGHVLFAILWVGNSFLFNYLDNKLNKNISNEDIDGEGYLMHSGFYYKLTRLKKSPPNDYLNKLIIFKWQSYLTFITGMLLLIIVYYYNVLHHSLIFLDVHMPKLEFYKLYQILRMLAESYCYSLLL